MKKAIIAMMCMTAVLCACTGCGGDDGISVKADTNVKVETGNNDSKGVKITVAKSCTAYEGDAWTAEKLKELFSETGFSRIECMPASPNDENFRSNIFSVRIISGESGESVAFNEGDKFDSNDKVVIIYNTHPMITASGNEELAALIGSADGDFKAFADKYDGNYIETEGIVSDSANIVSGVCDVKSSDSGAAVRAIGSGFDASIQTGQSVVISGKVNAAKSAENGMLCIDALVLEKK